MRAMAGRYYPPMIERLARRALISLGLEVR
jgi:hypothetical protein